MPGTQRTRPLPGRSGLAKMVRILDAYCELVASRLPKMEAPINRSCSREWRALPKDGLRSVQACGSVIEVDQPSARTCLSRNCLPVNYTAHNPFGCSLGVTGMMAQTRQITLRGMSAYPLRATSPSRPRKGFRSRRPQRPHRPARRRSCSPPGSSLRARRFFRLWQARGN